MHTPLRALGAGLILLAVLPAHAAIRELAACTGPADPAPCILEDRAPDRFQFPESGPAARVSGNRLVISWVGDADRVELTGSIVYRLPLAKVAPDLHQLVLRYPRAQQTRADLRFAVTRRGETTRDVSQVVGLAGPDAFTTANMQDALAVARMSGSQVEPFDFGQDQPRARAWLPPGYRAGVRYPILYLADGGGSSPGSLLAEPMRKGEMAPAIVVGIDYAPGGRRDASLRNKSYLGASSGAPGREFLAHERFLLDTVIPTVEARYGVPPERRLRAIGGSSSGAVWAASMALRNPGVFGTAFVMSPGVRPAQHGLARSSVRFYVSAGELEPGFHWSGACLAGEIVARGGVASFTSYPSGHDVLMWAHSLADHARDWLGPQERTPLMAALPDAGCADRPQWK